MDHLTLFDGKVCNTCGVWKPLTDYRQQFQRGKVRVFHQCRRCTSDVEQQRYYLKHDEIRERERKKAANRTPERAEALRQYNADWRRANAECKRQKDAEWRANNAERRKVNLSRWQRENKEKVSARNQRWRKKNPEMCRAANLRRRARESNCEGAFTAEEWVELCEKYAFTCLSCKRREPEIKLTVDHVKPISKGGTNYIANIQPLCLSCNQAKSAHEVDYRHAWTS